MRKKQQTTEHEDSHGHIISHHAPAVLLRAEKNIIKLGSNVCVCVCVCVCVYIYIYIHIQGSRLRPFFESVRVKILHGRTCASAWSALLQSARCQPQHIVAGERFHWSREERRFQQEREGARNGGFGFQTKIKDRFLNQRRWTCWYSCRENMQVLSATASLVLLWKACYLRCLLHVTLWRLSLFFLYYYYLIPQCLLNIL